MAADCVIRLLREQWPIGTNRAAAAERAAGNKQMVTGRERELGRYSMRDGGGERENERERERERV